MIHTDGAPTIAHYGVGDGKAKPDVAAEVAAVTGFEVVPVKGINREIVGYVTPEFSALLSSVHRAAADEIRNLRGERISDVVGVVESAKLGVEGAAKGFEIMGDRTFTGAEVAEILNGAVEGI